MNDRPNRHRNKAASSNFFGVVWRGPELSNRTYSTDEFNHACSPTATVSKRFELRFRQELLGEIRFKYEIEYENDFSILLCSFHITNPSASHELLSLYT